MKNIVVFVLLILFTSCDDFLEDYSQDLVVPKTVTDLNEVLLGSAYLKSTEVPSLSSGSFGWWLHLLDDDINTVVAKQVEPVAGCQEMGTRYWGYFAWQNEVGRSHDGGSLRGDNDLWDGIYNHINAVNILLNEVGEIDLRTEQDRLAALRLRGECYFLRAQFYLVMVNVYADVYTPEKAASTLGVPLKLTHYVEHDKTKKAQFERTPVSDVYAQIVKDLQASIECFQESPQNKTFYRASEEAASLLLSRVYLYMQDWKSAWVMAENFLSKKSDLLDLKTIEADISSALMTGDNPEIIFSQGSLSLQNSFSGEGGDFCVSRDLLDLYDEGDYRYSIYFERSVRSDSVGLGRKYKMGTHRSLVSDFYMLRTAEGYLNMAEACAMLGDAFTASEYLNRLRRHRIAGYQDTVYSETDIVNVVRNERRKELVLEGHRWFDLRRYAVNQTAPYKKPIYHVYAVYEEGQNLFQHGEVYRLEVDDPAYTFAIPKSVLEFDTEMPDNIRIQRKYLEKIDYEID